MPAIKVQAPSGEQARSRPREFALLCQAGPGAAADGEVQLEALQRIVGECGSKDSPLPEPSSASPLSFDALAPALAHPPTHPGAEGAGNTLGFAARDASGALSPLRFERRAVGPDDIRIQIAYCGICHSDLHQIRNEWRQSKYPMVPGHEIVGVVTEVGSAVSEFKPGDVAGVGCMVNSCGSCSSCGQGLEQYCPGVVWTYNSTDADGTMTQGGYSTHIVLSKKFAVHIPPGLHKNLDAAAPLLCAGITTYSPLRHFGLDKPGTKVGVVGLGGLGHMAVQFARAFGCEVTVISTSPGKKEEALGTLGAHHFLVSKDAEAMKAAAGSLDGIIDTVSAKHALNAYLALLRLDGKLIMVGLPEEPVPVAAFSLTARRRILSGSSIGGIKETQEMLDFCAEHGIACRIERIPVDYVNTAMERLEKNDVKYRFVIDVQGTLVA